MCKVTNKKNVQRVMRMDSEAYIWSLAGELKQGELSYVEFIRKFLNVYLLLIVHYKNIFFGS